ncbi:MAG: hypothetical protein LBV32_01675 [Tannerellaceae bacterium]|jgi:hypothetical protein|nr:hypothetical protein [Tannerellaceae bacterium]
MKENVEKLCRLFREHVVIPVFDYSLPDDFSSTCLVIREDSYNLELAEGEYHLNIYVPNKLRIFGDYSDNSYPDIDKIDILGEQIISLFNTYWHDPYKCWIHTRKYIKERNMHYLNICLTIIA